VRRWLRLAWACLGLLTACHPVPPPSPPVPVGPSVCGVKPLLAPEYICVGFFTESGAPCVSCRGGALGCYDVATGVYCVNPTCLDDRACSTERQDVLGARR
jgi:hypothetical protein